MNPKTAGQRKLRAAYRYAKERAESVAQNRGEDQLKKLIKTLAFMEMISFEASDTGKAIRMLQTVNDRGLPLTMMDKAKSLLVYYSNRYLDGSLDDEINDAFGVAFVTYDRLREFVRDDGYRINNISRDTFSEDDILRYHYLGYTYPDIVNGEDYDGSSRTVYEEFLKKSLKSFAESIKTALADFIADYISDLSAFARSYDSLIQTAASDPRYDKAFIILGLPARLYPLAVRLHQRGMVEETVPGSSPDFLAAIMTTDVRVYKTRGTDPACDIGDISHYSWESPPDEIADGLRYFVKLFMPDGYLAQNLRQDRYQNRSVFLVLVELDEAAAGQAYDVATLAGLSRAQATRERIIAQHPNFSVAAHGFHDEEDFLLYRDQFGNLLPLSKSENSRCNNVSVQTMMSDQNLHLGSQFRVTRDFAHSHAGRNTPFGKADIEARTERLTDWATSRWGVF